MTFSTRQIAKQFVAKQRPEGAGVMVRRSIGSAQMKRLDPFLMLDDVSAALPAGFPDHPHRGFETVTYVLPSSKGHMRHEDFLGNAGELRPGDLQWMTPGKGIMHAEMPASKVPAHALQLWVNLPKSKKIMEPRYQEIKREQVPHVFNDDQTVEAIIFAGEVFGQKGPIETEAPVTYIHFILKQNATLEYRIPQGHNAFVYTVSGTGKCNDSDICTHEAIILKREGDGVSISATSEDDLEIIVVSGQPLEEPVFQYGPFVMTTSEEIEETWEDFEYRKNGFEHAKGWRSSIGRRFT